MPTPAEPGQPQERRVVEPVRVLRPRNTDALAELVREMTETTEAAGEAGSYESIRMPAASGGGEAETEELPPVGPWATKGPAPGGGRDWAAGDRGRPGPSRSGARGRGRAPRAGYASAAAASGRRAARAGAGARSAYGFGYTTPADTAPPREHLRHGDDGADGGDGAGMRGGRRAAVVIGVCAAALLGFAGAFLVPGRGGEAAAETVSPSPSATVSRPADPDGAGTLREGDSGTEVKDLQERLLRIPDVYRDGATDGQYTTALTEAVGRFQLWYGVRGDEDGVYGDDTREALESRTGG